MTEIYALFIWGTMMFLGGLLGSAKPSFTFINIIMLIGACLATVGVVLRMINPHNLWAHAIVGGGVCWLGISGVACLVALLLLGQNSDVVEAAS